MKQTVEWLENGEDHSFYLIGGSDKREYYLLQLSELQKIIVILPIQENALFLALWKQMTGLLKKLKNGLNIT